MRCVKLDAQYIQRTKKGEHMCANSDATLWLRSRCVAMQSYTMEVMPLLELLIGILTTSPTELRHTRLPLIRCEKHATLTSSIILRTTGRQHCSSKRVQTQGHSSWISCYFNMDPICCTQSNSEQLQEECSHAFKVLLIQVNKNWMTFRWGFINY
jgi:hypothetical protein